MAEYGAHLNQSASSEAPTFFEVIAQESMTSVLRPAMTYALKTIASSHPDNLGWLWRYGDEIYSVMDYVLQNFYLKKYSGTFSEHFYGLKRLSIWTSSSTQINGSPQSTGVADTQSKLTDRQRYYSLLTIVVIPYLKLKLDQYFERLREETGEAVCYVPRRQKFLQHLKRIFVTVYPFLHCTWESIFLCYQLMYMFSSSITHFPLLHWIGLKLQRLSREDILAQTMEGNAFYPPTGQSWLNKLYALPSTLNSLLVKVLANGLPIIVFFLKFLEWWYSSENSHTVAAVTQLPVPPPPPQLQPAQFGVQLPSHPAQCPLCKKVRTNPTALSTSGYVFCYPCIYRHLGQHGCCPVTHLPSTQEQLVRLYINKEN
ncbi:peroxisome assembly protein 12-like [Actinia tenebrosa]|uniref:Peroxisome assembly protein 12 n=1 Tax=Actinia tenebrosa TaxID=6105 RepID=A0A6P8HFF4_ACTTE|nr:peroxisome assembly protein 12-like [Actinia tenebrosa]